MNIYEDVKEVINSINNFYVPEILENSFDLLLLTNQNIFKDYKIDNFWNEFEELEQAAIKCKSLFGKSGVDNLSPNETLSDVFLEVLAEEEISLSYDVYNWNSPIDVAFNEMKKTSFCFWQKNENTKCGLISTIDINIDFLKSKKREFTYQDGLLYHKKKIFSGIIRRNNIDFESCYNEKEGFSTKEYVYENGLPRLIKFRIADIEIILNLFYGRLYHKGFLFDKKENNNIRKISVELYHCRTWSKNTCIYKSNHRWGYLLNDEFVNFLHERYELNGKIDLAMFLEQEEYFYNRDFYTPIRIHKYNVSGELTQEGKEIRDESISNERAIDDEIKYNESLQKPYNDDLDSNQQLWLEDI